MKKSILVKPLEWERAYRKALKQFGSNAQAERIAWGAVNVAQPRRREGLRPGGQTTRQVSLQSHEEATGKALGRFSASPSVRKKKSAA